jgi:1,4-alpha-glucan branching enzyme
VLQAIIWHKSLSEDVMNDFLIIKSSIMESEKLAGMGAIVEETGVAFRVWAPNANKVCVTGTFNDWSDDKNELESEENGFWYGSIEDVKFGDQYKFVIYNSGQKLIKNDPYARELTNSVGNSVIVDPYFGWEDVEFGIPSWNELVIYEIHVGTFNAPQRDMPGNFQSVQRKIPYLKELGINAIQIMPAAEFPGDYSWGYNAAHPFAVESAYGNSKDFKSLINEAHKAGIVVILDVVYNHFGPDDLDLWRFDGWYENDKGGIYFYNDWRSETPWGNTRPDYGRPEVKQYLRDNALMWLEEYHIDGLRFDATGYIRNSKGQNNSPKDDIDEGWSFMQWINKEIEKRSPSKITIAEDFSINPWITKSTGVGGAGFSSQWDYIFAKEIRKNVIVSSDDSRNMDVIAENISRKIDDNPFSRVIYTESHDEIANGQSRLPEEIWPGNVDNWFSRKRSILGAALVLTSPGIPMLFQGQEFLEDHLFQDRDPLDWNLAEKYSGIRNLHQTFIKLRRNLEGMTKGLSGQNAHVFHVNNNQKVIAFHRWFKGGPRDSVVVIMNFRDESFESYVIGVPAAGKWKVRLNSDWKGYNSEFSDNYTGDPDASDGKTDGLDYYISVSIGPYSVLILSQD